MATGLLKASQLAAAEASAVAALASAAAKARVEEADAIATAEAAALENLAAAAAEVREVPRPPKAAPPPRELPKPPSKGPTWRERQTIAQERREAPPEWMQGNSQKRPAELPPWRGVKKEMSDGKRFRGN
mmetsp:Transcript_41639/g.73116  ORF Transcript_41639/g.73116 Transcript_41639/m.73116 type:complete len:130 (-) Transcript_41639:64-453(-)